MVYCRADMHLLLPLLLDLAENPFIYLTQVLQRSFFSFACLFFITFRNPGAAFTWDSSVNARHLAWGWDATVRFTAVFQKYLSSAQVYGRSHGFLSQEHKGRWDKCMPSCISEIKYKFLKAPRGESSWYGWRCHLAGVLLPPSLWHSLGLKNLTCFAGVQT